MSRSPRASAAFDRDEVEEESYFAWGRRLARLSNLREVFEEAEGDLGTFLFDLYMQGEQEDEEIELMLLEEIEFMHIDEVQSIIQAIIDSLPEVDEFDSGPRFQPMSKNWILHPNDEVDAIRAERGGERDYKGPQYARHKRRGAHEKPEQFRAKLFPRIAKELEGVDIFADTFNYEFRAAEEMEYLDWYENTSLVPQNEEPPSSDYGWYDDDRYDEEYEAYIDQCEAEEAEDAQVSETS